MSERTSDLLLHTDNADERSRVRERGSNQSLRLISTKFFMQVLRRKFSVEFGIDQNRFNRFKVAAISNM